MKYQYFNESQRNILYKFLEVFKLSSLSDVGRFFNLSSPYCSARSMFNSKKPNKILLKLIEQKEKDNIEIQKLKHKIFMLNKE